jgi:hypothetical protein
MSEDPQAMRRGLGMDTIVVATALPAVIVAGIARRRTASSSQPG